MLKALLVDDEIASIRSLEILLRQFCKQVEVIGSARSVDEALLLTAKLKPDLIVLDVEMPDGTGFDFLEKCTNRNFEVVFITAHDSYAVRAFKYSAIDYILKPVEIDDLISAVEKVAEIRKSSFNSRNKYNALFDNLKAIIPQKFVVASNRSSECIDLREVLFFEQTDGGVTVRFENGNSLRIDDPFSLIEEQLLDRDFYRIHHCYLVNTQKVRKIIKEGNGRVELTDGAILPLNPLKKEELILRLSDKNSYNR